MTRIEEQKSIRIEQSNAEITRLNDDFLERAIEPILVTLKLGHKDPEFVRHTGEEFYYVIEGIVLIYVADKEYLLRKGDAIHFPSTVRHMYENPLNTDTKLICVITQRIF